MVSIRTDAREQEKNMKINANMSALVTNKQLLRIENNMASSMERLSSGLKLNHAKDNPAGMAISKKMRTQIAGLDRASQNASDGISAIRIADGALNETSSILQRMRELSVQAANDTNSLQDREAIQKEIESLKDEVTRISKNTEYNELPLLDGSLSARVYADHVSRISISDTVAAGKYKLTVDTPAETAKLHGTADINPVDDVTKLGESGTVTVNGISVELDAKDSHTTVYEKLRNAAQEGGLELSRNNGLVFASEEYGKYATAELRFSSQELATKLGFADAVLDTETKEYVKKEAGADAKISLETDTDKSAFRDGATVSQDDNKITITDRGGFSFSFLLEEKYQGAIDFDVTDIGTMTLHIGANMDQNMVVSVPEISTESLYIDDLDVTKAGGADKAMRRLDEAIAACSNARSALGAYENRLEYSVTSLDAFEENMTNALSRLADTDMAEEMTTYTQQNVLNQAAISVLTQANDMPQSVLQLLQ